MASAAFSPGELLYEANMNITKVTEYGLSLGAFLSGQASPGPEGARIDVAFEGTIAGPKMKGRVSGIDYIRIRADGHAQLHVHAEITLGEGDKVALFADGLARPEPGTNLLQIRENVTYTTSVASYGWVNKVQGWGQGMVDPAKGVIKLKVSAA